MAVIDVETLQKELEKLKKDTQENLRQQLEAFKDDILAGLAFEIRSSGAALRKGVLHDGCLDRQQSGASWVRQESVSQASEALFGVPSKEARSDDDLATQSLLAERRHNVDATQGTCSWMAWMVTHPIFDKFLTLLVTVNIVCMACETDYLARNFLSEPPPMFRYVDTCFCTVFVIEITLRLLTHGVSEFFCNKNMRFWNIFDFVVVSMQAIELVALEIGSAWAPMKSTVRCMRTFQIARVLRVARFLRLFPQLRVLLVQIFHSFMPLFWVFILVFGVTLVFATILTQVVTDFKIQNEEEYNEGEGEMKDLHMFDTLLMSMLALYQTISDGKHWGELSEPLMEIEPALSLLFVGYTFFVIFAFMNVVTSQFVEEALESAKKDEKQQTVEKLESIFKLSKNPDKKDVEISEEQFLALCAESDMMREYLQQLYNRKDVSAEEVQEERLFQILDADRSGYVSTQELVVGCERLSRAPTVLDLASFRLSMVDLFEKMETKVSENAKRASHRLTTASLHQRDSIPPRLDADPSCRQPGASQASTFSSSPTALCNASDPSGHQPPEVVAGQAATSSEPSPAEAAVAQASCSREQPLLSTKKASNKMTPQMTPRGA